MQIECCFLSRNLGDCCSHSTLSPMRRITGPIRAVEKAMFRKFLNHNCLTQECPFSFVMASFGAAVTLCPERFIVQSVCTALLLGLDVNTTCGLTERQETVTYPVLEKITFEMLTSTHTKKRKLPWCWTTDLQNESAGLNLVISATWLCEKNRHTVSGRQRISLCACSSCRFWEILARITLVYHEPILQISPIMLISQKNLARAPSLTHKKLS